MEKVRAFERSCLRACTKLYRSSESNYQKYVSNELLYEVADIPRIDNFIIQLTRDYYAKLPLINNTMIQNLAITNIEDIEVGNLAGCIPPQAFMHFDAKGVVQDGNNIPVLYHWKRNKANKRISLQPDSYDNMKLNFTYSTSIPERDSMDFKRLDFKKYWWLNANCKHMKMLQRRRQRKYAALI